MAKSSMGWTLEGTPGKTATSTVDPSKVPLPPPPAEEAAHVFWDGQSPVSPQSSLIL